jgi:hypothetical protein
MIGLVSLQRMMQCKISRCDMECNSNARKRFRRVSDVGLHARGRRNFDAIL